MGLKKKISDAIAAALGPVPGTVQQETCSEAGAEQVELRGIARRVEREHRERTGQQPPEGK